jgi:hypothetical protein
MWSIKEDPMIGSQDFDNFVMPMAKINI